jgi:hypothetical protein
MKKTALVLTAIFILITMSCQAKTDDKISIDDLVATDIGENNIETGSYEPAAEFFADDGLRENSYEILDTDTGNVFFVTEVPRDPFLLYYLRNNPTLIIDISENVVEQRISYNHHYSRDIFYGDNVKGVSEYTIYQFENELFSGIESVLTDKTGVIERYKDIIFYRNQDGVVNSIDQYRYTGTVSQHHSYSYDDNIIIDNDGMHSGARSMAVIVEEEDRYLYYRDYQGYMTEPEKPHTIIEFVDENVIITEYYKSSLNYFVYSKFYFTNGILMKREYMDRYFQNMDKIDGYIETYTVSSGKGEIIVTNTSGEITERRILERRINAAGYLEYELVIYPSGNGYEYFFTKDMF